MAYPSAASSSRRLRRRATSPCPPPCTALAAARRLAAATVYERAGMRCQAGFLEMYIQSYFFKCHVVDGLNLHLPARQMLGGEKLFEVFFVSGDCLRSLRTQRRLQEPGPTLRLVRERVFAEVTRPQPTRVALPSLRIAAHARTRVRTYVYAPRCAWRVNTWKVYLGLCVVLARSL